MNGVFLREIGVPRWIFLVHRGFERIHAVSLHERAGGAFIATTKHSFTKDAWDRARDVAHGFEFGTGNLVIVAEADAVPAKDGANSLDVTRPPGIEHLIESPLRMEDIPESGA